MSASPKPRPRRRALWAVALVAFAALFLALVIPGSPMHLSVLLAPPPKHDGRGVQQLVAGLDDSDPVVRRDAATSLGRLNTQATDALPQLTRVMREDPHPLVRAAAAGAISKMAPASRSAVGELAQALSDPEPLTRMNAALALLELREDARPAIPALIAAADDEENDTNLAIFHVTIRQVVLRALGHAAAGTPEAVPAFTALLEGQAADASRAIAAWGLGMAGEHARDATPLVRAMLKDPNGDVRTAAEEALDRMGAPRDGLVRRGEFDGLELPEAERARIWEIEHRVNVLNKYGFEPLAAALLAADREGLKRHLAPAFAGSEPAAPRRVKSSGFAEVERLQDSGAPPVPVTAEQFLDRLLGWRKLFGPTPKVKLVAATLRPKALDDPAGPWAGQALLRIHGESGPGAPAEVTATLDYELPGPAEEVFAAGGWLRAARVRQVAVARSPGYLFAEVAKARGLNTNLHDNWVRGSSIAGTGGVYVTDFDRDGYLDVLVTDLTGNTLYRGGPGGQFRDVTREMGLPRGRSATAVAAAWVDIDGDGWDDLILGERVYRNEEGKRFVDYTSRVPVLFPPDLTGIIVADFDRDGKLDLYLTRIGPPGNLSWLAGRSNDSQGNRLLRNLGDWKFEDVTKKSGTRGGYRSSFTAAWLDADDDGWPDLFVPNELGDAVLLMNNRDGTFRPHALADHPVDFGTMGVAVGDVDNDGRIDVYCANMYSKAGTRVIGNMRPDSYPPRVMEKLRRLVAGSQLHLNKGGAKFDHAGAEKQLATVGWAYGPALADLDGDGFLDVYATAGYISRDRSKPDG